MEDEINIYCTKGQVFNNLEEILNQENEQKLNEIYYYLYNKEIKTNKNTLIKKISKKLINSETIYNIINNLYNDEYNLLENIINNNGVLQDNNFKLCNCQLLICHGVLYLINDNNNVYLVIPKEIIEIINKLDLDKIKNQVFKNTRLSDLAYSMINLYGIVKLEDYIDYCIKYYNYEDIKEINFLSVVLSGRFNHPVIYEIDDTKLITKEEFLEFGHYELLESKFFQMDFNNFDKKDLTLSEILQYKDLSYYEKNKEANALYKFLKKYDIEDDDINFLIGVIVETTRIDYMSGILDFKDIFLDFNINIDENNFNELITLINNLYYSIPVWGSEGWTMKEILLFDNEY